MNSGTTNGFCNRHCKTEVYTAEKVDQLIQEALAGKNNVLAWYKGTKENYNYNYINGSDPKNIELESYADIVTAIVGELASATNNDIAVFMEYANLAVELWNASGKYFLFVNGNTSVILIKVNSWVKEFTLGETDPILNIKYVLNSDKTDDANTLLPVVFQKEIGITTIQGSPVIDITDERFKNNTYIDIYPVREDDAELLRDYMISYYIYLGERGTPGEIVIGLTGTSFPKDNIKLTFKVTPVIYGEKIATSGINSTYGFIHLNNSLVVNE